MLHPRSISWVFLLQTTRTAELRQQSFANQIPGDEGQVGESALVANQPTSTVYFETEFQDTDHAIDFIDVALDGRRKLLGMEACKPSCLTVIWPLPYAESACEYHEVRDLLPEIWNASHCCVWYFSTIVP